MCYKKANSIITFKMTIELYKVWSTQSFLLQIWKNMQLEEIYPQCNKLLESLIYK